MISSAKAFRESSRKSITLMGMSGVGKTYLSSLMSAWGWAHYSCDLEIGKKFLSAELPSPVTCAEDLSHLSSFIGKLGAKAQGGLDLTEFKRRQKLYYDAECKALEQVPSLSALSQKFMHDSTGSLCEIMDEDLIDRLGQASLFVYIKASKEDEAHVLQRAREYPKPLFFPPDQFDSWLGDYLAEKHLDSSEQVNPDDFARWVFPRLFQSRLPKYQRLADRYGVTVPAAAFRDIKDEASVLDVIASALDQRHVA
jgi:hypothetical protein